MTSERRVVFDLSDIESLAFQCSSCSARLVIPTDRAIQNTQFHQCPVCRTQWYAYGKTDAEVCLEFVKRLQQLRRLNGDAGFTLKLVFDESGMDTKPSGSP